MIPCYQTLAVSENKYDSFWAWVREIPGFSALQHQSALNHPLTMALLRDVFILFYWQSVSLQPIDKVPPEARLNYLIVVQLTKSCELQELRLRTRGKRLLAFLAALEIIGLVSCYVSIELWETVEKLVSVTNKLREADGKGKFLADILARAQRQAKPLPFHFSKAYFVVSRRAKTLHREQRALLAELMRLWYSGIASGFNKVLEGPGAGETLEGALRQEGSVSLPEEEGGLLKEEDNTSAVDSLQNYLTTNSAYSDNPKLQAIARKALETNTLGLVKRFVTNYGELLNGVCTGDIIELLLQEQWQDFFSPQRRKRFYADLIEQQLWMLDLEGRKRDGRLIICLDCSGSMLGPKEVEAKAITLVLLEAVVSLGRNSTVLLFGDRDSVKAVDIDRGRITEKGLFDIVHTFFASRATDFTRPLEMALDKLKAGEKQNDLLFITDGFGAAAQEIVEQIYRYKKKQRLFTWAILIGGGASREKVSSFVDSMTDSREFL